MGLVTRASIWVVKAPPWYRYGRHHAVWHIATPPSYVHTSTRDIKVHAIGPMKPANWERDKESEDEHQWSRG
jgi:hypothetical protein